MTMVIPHTGMEAGICLVSCRYLLKKAYVIIRWYQSKNSSPNDLHFIDPSFYFATNPESMKPRACLMALAISCHLLLQNAQLRSTPFCPPFNTDILDGTVSRLFPQSPHGDIKNRLPCFRCNRWIIWVGLQRRMLFKDKVYILPRYIGSGKITRVRWPFRWWVPTVIAYSNGWDCPGWKMSVGKPIKWNGSGTSLFCGAEGKVNRIIISSRARKHSAYVNKATSYPYKGLLASVSSFFTIPILENAAGTYDQVNFLYRLKSVRTV